MGLHPNQQNTINPSNGDISLREANLAVGDLDSFRMNLQRAMGNLQKLAGRAHLPNSKNEDVFNKVNELYDLHRWAGDLKREVQ